MYKVNYSLEAKIKPFEYVTNKKILLDANVDYLTEGQIQNNSVNTCIGLFEKRWYSESNYHMQISRLYYSVFCFWIY